MVRIPAGQIGQVFTVTGQPADGREMPLMGQRLIQPPEAADKTLCILRYRFGEVAALGGYRTDNGNASLRAV